MPLGPRLGGLQSLSLLPRCGEVPRRARDLPLEPSDPLADLEAKGLLGPDVAEGLGGGVELLGHLLGLEAEADE